MRNICTEQGFYPWLVNKSQNPAGPYLRAMAIPSIVLKSVTIRYYGKLLFNKVSFTANSHEAWLIIGESGSGKTALLETILGKWPVVSGSVTIDFDTNKFKSGTSLVAAKHAFTNRSNTKDFYYQQRYNSYDSDDSMTVDSYLNSLSEDRNSVARIVATLRIDHLADEELIKLSNGETKKVLLAAALVKQPAILLLDNFFAGLDISSRDYFSDVLAEVRDQGATIILTSALNECPPFVSHVAMLASGILTQKEQKKFEVHESWKNKLIYTKEQVQPFSVKDKPNYASIVKLSGVNLKYEGKAILDDIDWEVKTAERWAISGPNGAGKTSLLSLLTGDNPQAYANNIVLFDRRRGSGESIWDIKRKIGFLSSELHQYFPMDTNCFDAIESGFYDTLGLFRTSNIELRNQCLAMAALLGIDHLKKSTLFQASYKEQRMCLLARALVKGAPLLILDEPFQGFSDKEIEKCRQLIDLICESNSTAMIFVSHYSGDIPSCVSYLLELTNGKITYKGLREKIN